MDFAEIIFFRRYGVILAVTVIGDLVVLDIITNDVIYKLTASYNK